ncbi:MAG TPA: acetylornithine/succinylornithine family transaminase [Vicinamibacterales bacterium]|jgi:acetylornithine/N-succinyldiaminopimelate aminotransferase|nr:acetylornithine/succinylornithine family transaminase [Vicinamibacterales bacterium]
MNTVTDVISVEKEHLLQVYRRGSVVFDRGRGCRLFDTNGRGYLDLISGVGVASLGHAHPKLAAAVADQAQRLVHTSNLFFHPLQGELATRLAKLSGLPRAFFCNSGAEAVEATLKFARRYWFAQGKPRSGFVAFDRSFHGRTMGAVSVTWDDHYRAPFQPLVPNVTFVPADDVAALRAAVTEHTAAIIVEPIQGEGGIRPLGNAMGAAIMDAARATGALVIADEVQCGLGRTGRAFYSPVIGVEPDLMAIGKSLGAGVPIAAALFSERVAAAAAFGDHGSTYGGNLLACRAALVFLDELESGGLMTHVARAGEHLSVLLNHLQSRHPMIQDVRGEGLMWGLDLDRPAAPIVDAAIQQGLLVNRTADTVVRLLPPYIITNEELDEGIGLLDAAFVAAFGGQQR